MPVLSATSHLAGPVMKSDTATDSCISPHAAQVGPASQTIPRRIKVTAIVTRGPDGTEATSYNVEEIPELDSCDEKPLTLAHRRLRSESQSTIFSEDSHLRTPTSPFRGLPLVEWPITPPAAPRIPLPPSPRFELSSSWGSSLSTRRNVGLGLDLTGCQSRQHASITYPQPEYQDAYGHAGQDTVLQAFEPFTLFSSPSPSSSEPLDEEPYYYLPSNLISPELEMSTTEFKKSVMRWMARRKELNNSTHDLSLSA